MIILVLDPAASTGYALVSVEADDDGWWCSADIFEYGYIQVDTSSNFQGDHCLSLIRRLQKFRATYDIGHVVVEDFFFSKKTAVGCHVNVAFRTAIHIWARRYNIEYTIIGITDWKKYIAGRSTPTKEQKKEWGPTPSKKIYIQDALWNKFGIRFPNHSISEKTGKPIAFRYDIVDVVGQAIYYCGVYCCVPLKNISCSVEVPEDVESAKKFKKQYLYE